MSRTDQTNREILRRYTNQALTMPADLRARIEKEWGGEQIEVYGLADLDGQLKLTEEWLALGSSYVARVDSQGTIHSVAREQIRRVEERPSLSATTLSLVGEPEEGALITVRYSFRQQNTLGAIAFVLKQALEGNPIRHNKPDLFYADAVARPIREAQGSIAKNKFSVLLRLVGYLKPYVGFMALGVVANIMLTVLMLLPPQIMASFIDDIVTPATQGELPRSEAYRHGWTLIGLLVLVFFGRDFFLWIRLRTLTVVGEYVARDLRRHIYDHLHRLSISFFSRHQTGSIISRVGSDTDRIWDFIAFGMAELLFGVILLVGLSIVMIVKDWQLGLILVLPLPILFYFLYAMGRRLHGVFIRIWQRWSEMTARVADTVSGIRVVQAFSQSDYERGRFNDRNNSVLDEAISIHRIWTTRWPIMYFGVNLLIVAIYSFGLPRMLGQPGFASMEIGEFVQFLLYMNMFIMPLEMFGFLTRMFNRSISSAQRVFEILDTEPDVREVEDGIRLEPLQGHIVFKDVTFGYDSVRQILKGVSFEVAPGEMIGLVGPSGAGKTTIINLIARFYDIHSGQILIDGNEIAQLDLGEYRKQIGMVMQDPYLFHGTILDNIKYGCHSADEQAVIAAARAANAHDFICKLTNGYDTLVGERGHTLSGGERQRISIARAILHNPRVLILDEATSSVDTETERKIQQAIDRLIEGRTVIAIAHRLSTLSRANRLFVMKDGKLVETGTHEELLQDSSGVYFKLHNIQRELHEMYAV